MDNDTSSEIERLTAELKAERRAREIAEHRASVLEDYATSRLCSDHRDKWMRERCALCELTAMTERAAKAEENYQFMVDRAADEKLDGYRELGQRAGDAENRADRLTAELATMTAERDRLQAFKDYVHERLDAAGVSVDPDSPHKDAGCRIGGRLDEVFAERDRYRAAFDEAALWFKCWAAQRVLHREDKP